MKKVLILSSIVLLAILISVSFADPQSSTDYKVIKNAVKKNGNTLRNPKEMILHMTVEEKNKTSVEIEIPFTVIEFLLESCKETDIHWDGDKTFKLNEVINKLKSSGPFTIIEIDNFDDNENVKAKIWLE